MLWSWMTSFHQVRREIDSFYEKSSYMVNNLYSWQSIRVLHLIHSKQAVLQSGLNNNFFLYNFINSGLQMYFVAYILKIVLNLWSTGSRPKVRDTTLKNHWNFCMQYFTSILCKHLINLDWFYSASHKSLRGFGEIE